MDTRKYGVAAHLYKPLVKRGVVDFAVGADWTPAAGDVKISKDGGAAANVTNLPTAIAMGNTAMWDFSLTAAELQAAQIKITVADAATKVVEDTLFEIETYGHASANVISGVSKNQTFTLSFLMTDNVNHNPVTGLSSVAVTRSIDGGTFSGGSLGSVAEVGFGYYKVTLAAADLNGAQIVLRATCGGCDDKFVEILTAA